MSSCAHFTADFPLSYECFMKTVTREDNITLKLSYLGRSNIYERNVIHSAALHVSPNQQCRCYIRNACLSPQTVTVSQSPGELDDIGPC